MQTPCELDREDLRDLKTNLVIKPTSRATIIYVVARHRTNNKKISLNCQAGKAMHETVYNTPDDTMIVQGVDYICLGEIPFSYEMSIEGVNDFSVALPLPEANIKKYLDEKQKKVLDHFKLRFNIRLYQIRFYQILKAF